jgi:hypothetical protein
VKLLGFLLWPVWLLVNRIRVPAWLIARRRRRIGPPSMVCVCGSPACVWLAAWPWNGRREFCGDCFARRIARQRFAGRGVLVVVGLAVVAWVLRGRWAR